MTLQSSGAISLSDIRDEYNNGSSAPIDIDDYYRGGSLVRANASNNTQTAVHYLLMTFMDRKEHLEKHIHLLPQIKVVLVFLVMTLQLIIQKK